MATSKTAQLLTPPSGTFRYTLAMLTAQVENALTMVPDANTTSAAQIVNDALAMLTTLHEWSWRQRELTLNATADQAYINLPSDFATLRTLYPASGIAGVLQAADLNEIVRLRGLADSDATSDSPLRYAIAFVPQSGIGALPGYRIELFPTPATTTSTGFLRGVYLRRLPELADDDQVPDMPAQFHPLLKTLCRALAVSDEEQQEGEEWRIFNAMLPLYIAEDGRLSPSLGPLRGAVMRQRRYDEPPTISIP